MSKKFKTCSCIAKRLWITAGGIKTAVSNNRHGMSKRKHVTNKKTTRFLSKQEFKRALKIGVVR